MNCIRTDNADDTILEVDGALDAHTTPDLRSTIDAIIDDRRRRVTLDISAVTLLDSSGVGAIVSLFRRVRARGGSVLVIGARNQPLAVLKLLRLDRIFRL